MSAAPVNRVRVELISAERLLASLADRSVDLVITDPPYVSVNRSSTGGHLRDWFEHGLTWPQIGRVFAIARRKLRPDGVLMAMTNNDGLPDAHRAVERAGFVGIRTITWDRKYPGLGSGLRHQCEYIIVGRLPGSRTLSGVDLVSVAAVGPGTADRYPTAKPEGLGRKLAAMAGIGRGSLVVDPFCGSGALLVGAVERGASVIAGDVAQRAVRQARARLAQASGKPAARPAPSKPGQRPGSGQVPARPRPAPAKPATRPAPSKPGQRPGTGTGPARPSKARGKPAARPAAKAARGKVRRQGGKAR
jgi:SAM-dependent methyltransferase